MFLILFLQTYFAFYLTAVSARLPLLARCATLDLATIPCDAGAACTPVNATHSQCLPTSRNAARLDRADRRSNVEKRNSGGQVNLINGTPFKWTLNATSAHSYQMGSWEWPQEVAPFSVVSVYVEFTTVFVQQRDDGGEVSYLLDGTQKSFEIQARGGANFNLQVQLTGMSTMGNPQGSTISLGWNEDGYVNWALAGKDASNLISSNPPVNWIQSVIPVMGHLKLGQFTLPGSHDAGMYLLNGTTTGARECNTLTQTGSIGAQLKAGARYFDLRPVISAGIFKTGHYSKVSAVIATSFQGGNGESLQDVVNDINDFTKDKAEVIVIRLAHDLNTDVGNSQYRPFNRQEVDRLFTMLKTIRALYIAPTQTADLTQLTLNQLTQHGSRSAVILQMQLGGEDTSLGPLQGYGFFTYEQLNAYNEYSSTNDLDEMVDDQFTKMKQQAALKSYFILSWTLTQSKPNVLLCPVFSDSIIELAKPARGALFTQLLPAVSPSVYPQMIQIDNFSASNDIVPLVLAIAYKAHAS